MREVKLNKKEHERFLMVMEEKMSERGLDNKALADELGIAVQSIYNFRTDKSRNPSKFVGAKVANYLGMIPKDWRS